MLARYVPLMKLFVVVLVIGLVVMLALFAQLVISGGKPDAPRTEAERAVFAAEESVKGNPQDPVARIKLSAAYLSQGANGKAEEQAKLALRLAPEDPSCYYALGMAQQASGKTAEGLKNLEKAAKTEGQMAQFYQDTYVAIARIHADQGDMKKALDAFDQALGNGPENAALLYERGQLYEQNEMFAFALEDYQAAMLFVPDYAEPKAAFARISAAHPDAVKQLEDIQKSEEATEPAGSGEKKQ